MLVDPQDLAHLVRDKYAGDQAANMREDIERLQSGEPLAYVIGWVPFLGLSIRLDSRPLIPRPETEWWTEALLAHLEERFGDSPFSFLDLCAGSGAIGLCVLARFPAARVSFAELSPLHCALIQMNIVENALDAQRATIRSGDLFSTFANDCFDVIATNPPYIPSDRELDESVALFEPLEALFAGPDGLSLIRTIISDAPSHLLSGGEIWIECDTSNAEETKSLCVAAGFKNVELRTDLYGRPRIVVGYFS